MIKKNILFPKKINSAQVKKYFIDLKLTELVRLSEINSKNINQLKSKVAYRPDLNDLYRLHQFILLNKRLTCLEIGCGWSSIIINHALKLNKIKYLSETIDLRKVNKFELHILDNEKKYLNLTRKNLKKYFDKKNLPFTYYSQCNMVLFNNQLATEFNNLPMINPDFIYLDGPDQFNIKNKLFGIDTGHIDLMPMSCDILKFENFLIPQTIIIIDGRTANARFLKNNFKRNWSYFYDDKNDQNIFVLDEKPFGIVSKKQINFYKKKIK